MPDDGYTPLHIAVKNKDHEAVEILLKRGADVNVRDDNGLTPLHYAVRYSIGAVEILLKYGADVNAQDDHGDTPLHCAVDSMDSIGAVEILLKRGANVDAQDDDGRTPLHYAVGTWLDFETAEVLLKYGANVNAQDDDGYTPLHYAEYYYNVSNDYSDDIRSDALKLMLLLNQGSGASMQNNSGQVPPPRTNKNNTLEKAESLLRKLWFG